MMPNIVNISWQIAAFQEHLQLLLDRIQCFYRAAVVIFLMRANQLFRKAIEFSRIEVQRFDNVIGGEGTGQGNGTSRLRIGDQTEKIATSTIGSHGLTPYFQLNPD
jgi:hypothetical protein